MTVGDDAGDERCIALSRLIDSHINHVRNQLPAGLVPSDGSAASTDISNGESGPGGAWGEGPVWTYLSVVGLRLNVAGDHLSALAMTLLPPVPLFGPAALVRASLENSGYASWLLDPSLDLRSRVIRSLALRLQSAVQVNRTMPFLADEWDDEGAEDEIREEVGALGFSAPEYPPSITELVGDVLEEHMLRPNAGRGIYKYLSALSHGTTYGTLQRYRVEGEGESSFTRQMTPHIGIESIEYLVKAALGAHVTAFSRAVTYCGLDNWAWNGWRRQVGTVLHAPESLRTS